MALGPFFFATYGFSNWVASERAATGAVFFDWERRIPFLPWTILPYWSIDLLYGLSFFVCRDRKEVDRHGLRLLTAQLISVSCFLLFPLHFAFERPVTSGLWGTLFDALMGFDKPYNQAPSLHIGLLVILWAHYARLFRGPLGWLAHCCFILIGVSVLTTYQHHFIDIPTGALVGFLCLWLWPNRGPSPLYRAAITANRLSRKLAYRYLAGAAAIAILAMAIGGAGLWLLWGAVAMTVVAANYLALGPDGFQKHGARHSLASSVLLAPYTAAAWVNSRLWTWRRPKPDLVAEGVSIGRMPTMREMSDSNFITLVDLCAELPAPVGYWGHYSLPWLDLVVPTPAQMQLAAERIEMGRDQGEVLVCCALGYSRSATAVAAWLIITGQASDLDVALETVSARRPGVVFSRAHRSALAQLSPATAKTPSRSAHT